MIRFYSFEGSSGWGSDNASEWDEFIGLVCVDACWHKYMDRVGDNALEGCPI